MTAPGDTDDMAPSIAGPGAVAAADARPRPGWHRYALLALGVFLLLAAIRWVTDSPDLTSSGTFSSTLRLAVPIFLAGLGGIYAERSGVVNIGLEGMMILGTWFGAWGAWQYGPWWGVAIGVLGGAAGGLLHAVATVSFGVDHIISGVAIITLATGVARYLSVTIYDAETGGGATQSPRVNDVGDVDIPILAGGDLFGWHSPDVLGWFEKKGWLFISDLAGLMRGFAANLSWLTVIALVLIPASTWLLWRTRFGLRLRSCGENPTAADSLGVPVYRMKYYGVVISGAMAGLAGAFLAIEAAGIYRQGQTAGRGFIGLAAMISGNYMPAGTAATAGLFGFADALRLRDTTAVHALLLFIAAAALIAVVVFVRRGQPRVAIALGAVAASFALWYFVSDEVPSEFVAFTPHVATIIVLSVAGRRLRMPAADGMRWRKGQVE